MSMLTLVPVNGEPRIQDLQLAERLGFSQPRDIRKLIGRNLEKLNQISVCATMAQTPGELGGRPTKAYYLNEKQSIFICMKADTVNAFEVQMEIIDVYTAYRHGNLIAPAQPITPIPAEPSKTLGLARYAELVEAENALLKQRLFAEQARMFAPEPIAVTTPRPGRASPEEEAYALERYTAGDSKYAIAKALGRHGKTIDRILARANRAEPGTDDLFAEVQP